MKRKRQTFPYGIAVAASVAGTIALGWGFQLHPWAPAPVPLDNASSELGTGQSDFKRRDYYPRELLVASDPIRPVSLTFDAPPMPQADPALEAFEQQLGGDPMFAPRPFLDEGAGLDGVGVPGPLRKVESSTEPALLAAPRLTTPLDEPSVETPPSVSEPAVERRPDAQRWLLPPVVDPAESPSVRAEAGAASEAEGSPSGPSLAMPDLSVPQWAMPPARAAIERLPKVELVVESAARPSVETSGTPGTREPESEVELQPEPSLPVDRLPPSDSGDMILDLPAPPAIDSEDELRSAPQAEVERPEPRDRDAVPTLEATFPVSSERQGTAPGSASTGNDSSRPLEIWEVNAGASQPRSLRGPGVEARPAWTNPPPRLAGQRSVLTSVVQRLPAVQPEAMPVPDVPGTFGTREAGRSESATAGQGELAGVVERAHRLNEQAFSLAERGAHYLARAKFIQALRLVAQALDGQEGTEVHSRSLANGLRAMDEADDFMPAGSQLEANLDMPNLVAGHRTPVLRDEPDAQLTPLAALQRYYAYAQEELARAGGELPVASRSLYGLGKLQIVMGAEPTGRQRMSGPKAMTLQQAALLIQPSNFRAANELGVLLARFGQYDEARRMLVQSVSTYPMPETWNNLAIVHERLQQFDLAERARQEYQLAVEMQRQQSGGVGGLPHPAVQWLPAEQFAITGGDHPPGPRVPAAPTTPDPNAPSSGTAWNFWPWSNSSR